MASDFAAASLRRRAPGQMRALLWSRVTVSLVFAAVLVFTIAILIPLAWTVQMSFKTTREILIDPYAMPSQLRLSNYAGLFLNPSVEIQTYFLNSVMVTGGALLISLLLSTMGGYVFGRMRFEFRGRKVFFYVLLFAVMLPPQIYYIPQYQMMAAMGLNNSQWSLILLYAAHSLPVSVYLMSTYFSQLPGELEDAAIIDGCNDWELFWQVMLPLARPAMTTIIILNALYFWNELLLAITVITDPSKRTLPAAIFNFIGELGSNFGGAAASLVVSMLPILVLYLFLSRRLIQGLTAGAVKG